jgi:hypothetical protein
MGQKHRAEVIEVYRAEGKAAVRFSWRGRERVECVSLYLGPDCSELSVGMRGWVIYTMTARLGLWGFEPFKAQDPMSEVLNSGDGTYRP